MATPQANLKSSSLTITGKFRQEKVNPETCVRETFLIMTLNLNGPATSKAGEKRQAADYILSAKHPDIVCVQEIGAPKKADWLLSPPVELKGHSKNTDKEAGVMWNGGVFELVEHFDQAFKLKVLDSNPNVRSQCPELAARSCIVKLTSKRSGKGIIVISWHGPHKVSVENKKMALDGLLKFAAILERKEKAPVLIGGDFNLDTTAALLIDSFHKAAPSEVSPRRKGSTNEDFFIFSHKLRVSDVEAVVGIEISPEDARIIAQVTADHVKKTSDKQRPRGGKVSDSLVTAASGIPNKLPAIGVVGLKVRKPEEAAKNVAQSTSSKTTTKKLVKPDGVSPRSQTEKSVIAHSKMITIDPTILYSLDHDAVTGTLFYT